MNWEKILVIGGILSAIVMLIEFLSRRAVRNAAVEERVEDDKKPPTSGREILQRWSDYNDLIEKERFERAERMRNHVPSAAQQQRQAEGMRNQASDDWGASPTNPLNPVGPLSICSADSSRDDSCSSGYDSGSSYSDSSCGGSD